MKKLFTLLSVGLLSMSLVGAELTTEEQLKLARQLSLEELKAQEAKQLAQALAETGQVTEEEQVATAIAQVTEFEETAQEEKELAQLEEEMKLDVGEEVPLSEEEVRELANIRARLALLRGEDITFLKELVQQKLPEPQRRWWLFGQQSYLPEAVHRQLDKWIAQQQDRNMLQSIFNDILTRQVSRLSGLKRLDKESNEYKKLEATLKAWDEVAEKINNAIKKLLKR